MATKINGYAVAGIGVGVLLFWSGITGRGILASLQSVIQGTSPQGNPSVNTPENTDQGATGSSPAGVDYPGYSGGGSPSQNKTLGKLIAASRGWSTGAEWDALVQLWDGESGWSNTADTRKTGLDSPNASVFAYGIPQARPYSKMPKAAWPPDKGGKASAADQIIWGLNYIKQTYGSPTKALAFKMGPGAGKGY